MTNNSPDLLIRDRFVSAGIMPVSVERKEYPEETIFVVRVRELNEAATLIANELDRELATTGIKGFVTVRSLDNGTQYKLSSPAANGVADPRISALINLISARSRTSEAQPSLSYIPDSEATILRAVTPRHHLIFGRRGAGKTALMVECKRRVQKQQNAQTVWINLQVYRHETLHRTFAWACRSICDRVLGFYANRDDASVIARSAAEIGEQLGKLIAVPAPGQQEMMSLIPPMHNLLRRFTETSGVDLFLFLDELHYLARVDQPYLLDMLHAIVRDSSVWLKIAGIRHLCRWFIAQPPIGLQTGHDAEHIDLDVTLQNPSRAKNFLEQVQQSFIEHVGIYPPSSVFSAASLDRLVLASGAVPRDYLILSAEAIRQAQVRSGKTVGVQDVNRAAGDLAKVKTTELEEDAASAEGESGEVLSALNQLRNFCLDEKNCTFFRIDFHEKETRQSEYNLIQDLMDLRLIHLIESSLSDERHAGRRSEVYMLDLSQFSGQRLRRRLKVLDFSAGSLVLKETGTTIRAKVSQTSRQRQGFLRRGPLFNLEQLSGTLAAAS